MNLLFLIIIAYMFFTIRSLQERIEKLELKIEN